MLAILKKADVLVSCIMTIGFNTLQPLAQGYGMYFILLLPFRDHLEKQQIEHKWLRVILCLRI